MTKFKLSKESITPKSFISKQSRNGSLADTNSGEILSNKVVSFGYKQVDNAEFVKLFTADLSWLSGLSKTALSILTIIFKNLEYNSDVVRVDLKSLKFKSRTSVYDGIKELVDKQIIAHTNENGVFYINRNLFFNGNRLL